jgi:hypothetical protein
MIEAHITGRDSQQISPDSFKLRRLYVHVSSYDVFTVTGLVKTKN